MIDSQAKYWEALTTYLEMQMEAHRKFQEWAEANCKPEHATAPDRLNIRIKQVEKRIRENRHRRGDWAKPDEEPRNEPTSQVRSTEIF